MVVDCDTWCNKKIPRGILIEFVQINLNKYLGM
jgi:hypothetical protein